MAKSKELLLDPGLYHMSLASSRRMNPGGSRQPLKSRAMTKYFQYQDKSSQLFLFRKIDAEIITNLHVLRSKEIITNLHVLRSKESEKELLFFLFFFVF